MATNGLGARLRYEFDKSMAAGTIALIAWLGLVSLIIIAIAGAFLAATQIAPAGEAPMGFIEGLWASLMVLNIARAATLALRYPALEARAAA